MYKVLCVVFILFSLFCSPPPGVKSSTDCTGPLIWRAVGDSATVYMFGSLHFGLAQFYPFDQKIEDAFHASEYLVVEVNPRKESFMSEISMHMASGILEDGKTLDQEISSEVYEQLSAALEKINFPIVQISNYKPWLAAVTLSSLQLQNLGYDPELGVENYFFDKAEGKSILELEDAASQMKLLSMLDGEEFLAYTILSSEKIEEMMDQLTAAWACGDSTTLSEVVLQDYSDRIENYEKIYEEMFIVRNRNMAEGISGLLKQKGTYFVAVGAGHFLGEDCIINFLREKGWTIERI